MSSPLLDQPPAHTTDASHGERPPYGAKPLELIVLHDGKPGHLSQLKGLTAALQRQQPCSVRECDVTTLSAAAWWRPPYGLRAHTPDLIIGAGHRTHSRLLRWSRYWRTPACCVMRPSLALARFFAVICPAHDNPPQRDNVFTTRIAMNPMTPAAWQPDPMMTALLIGGPSKHFHWSDAELLAHITQLLHTTPHRHWLLAPSRRTPADFLRALESMISAWPATVGKAPIIWPSDSPLHDLLRNAGSCCVTPDSFSMLSEALSMGIPTSIFPLTAKDGSRVAKGVAQLRQAGLIDDIAQHVNNVHQAPQKALNDTDRAAQWLLHRLKKHFQRPQR